MRVDAFQKMNFTGELWDYTTTIDPTTGTYNTYHFSKNISFIAVTQDKGVLSVFYPEQLRYNAQIRNLRDANGNAVFTEVLTNEDIVSYIGVSEPVFNVFGVLIGFRHDVSQGL